MKKPPLECHLCGARRWNDESVRWIYGDPFCADWCAERAWTFPLRAVTGGETS